MGDWQKDLNKHADHTLKNSPQTHLKRLGQNLQFVDDLQAVLNICAHAAKAIRHEMIYAQTQGLPDFQFIWIGSVNLAAWEVAFRARIKNIKEVTSLEHLSIWCEGDIMRYSATIKTIYGTGDLHG
ncbi:hypothetical protein [Bartonella tamiae]|uniref:Uncharacterized protein n=1 Tax=Bartonella tamiae Th239 TaxID=1094558 RepID=J1JVW6_9HYPH|nr:hypothetical protein [Bartonella tamiae]EJF89122.1 hypothetical protein ME5_01673 [Bartonella tamiae Th239]EJF95475.1 hypothetical protein MEG_00208 [Bartonella tamiae Th307]